MMHLSMKYFLLPTVFLFFLSCRNERKSNPYNPYSDHKVHKLKYNNPGLRVDLDVGFKSVPMPMDFDGDGDYDLLVSESGAYVHAPVPRDELLQLREHMAQVDVYGVLERVNGVRAPKYDA